MKYNATTSTLFQSIMEKAAAFFGLEKESATETDIDAALEGAPIADQIEAAKTEAVKDLKSELETLKASVSGQADQLKALEDRAQKAEDESEVKDTRITDLQLEVAAEKEALSKLSTQHKTEVSKLAGELAKSKAGIESEHDDGGGDDAIAKKEKEGSASGKMVVVQSSQLKKLTAAQSAN